MEMMFQKGIYQREHREMPRVRDWKALSQVRPNAQVMMKCPNMTEDTKMHRCVLVPTSSRGDEACTHRIYTIWPEAFDQDYPGGQTM